MVEKDTVRLMRECDAGIEMGVAAIDNVLGSVRGEAFSRRLRESREEHERLKRELRARLDTLHDEGKPPNAMAKGMSWMKTNLTLAMNESDAAIADLLTDGCHMGVKSLAKYLNQYAAASEDAKAFATRLIALEETLAHALRAYL